MEAAGPEDDFFASGGHSLLAMKLIHDVNEASACELAVEVAAGRADAGAPSHEVERPVANARGRAPSEDGAAPGRRAGSPRGAATGIRRWCRFGRRASLPPLFLVAGGMGGRAGAARLREADPLPEPRQPFYGLRARGVDDLVEPHESVEAMAAEHLKEIQQGPASRPVLHQRQLRGRRRRLRARAAASRRRRGGPRARPDRQQLPDPAAHDPEPGGQPLEGHAAARGSRVPADSAAWPRALRTGPGSSSRRPRSSASGCAVRRSATAICGASWVTARNRMREAHLPRLRGARGQGCRSGLEGSRGRRASRSVPTG